MLGSHKSNKTIERFVFIGICLSGFSALVYEVVWTRALALVMGSTTYALSTMLAAFMAGLALGGWLGGRLADRREDCAGTFAIAEIAIAVTGPLVFIAIKALDPIYAWLFQVFHLSFFSFSIAQFVLAFLLMLVPTVIMGATFPLALKVRARSMECLGRKAGGVYAINSLGAVVGSMAAGFLLIPFVGSLNTVFFAGFVNMLVGSVVLFLSVKNSERGLHEAWPIFAGALLLIFTYVGYSSFYTPRLTYALYSAERWGPYESFKSMREGVPEILYYKEGVQGEVMLFDGEPPVLISGGKVEGGETKYHALAGLLALASHPAPEKVLSIGLGTGNTLSTLARASVTSIDSVEINPDVMEATRSFVRPQLFNDPKIKHVVADARNFLRLSNTNYDAIVSVPSWPVESAPAALLTEEFFSIAKERLSDGGTFTQWVDYYLLEREDMRTLIRTFHRVFPDTTVWHTSGQVVLIVGVKEGAGSSGVKGPLSVSPEAVMESIKGSHPELAEDFMLGMSPDEVDLVEWIEEGPVNTDDHTVLEFSMAKSVARGSPER